jgi:hypothetical protein
MEQIYSQKMNIITAELRRCTSELRMLQAGVPAVTRDPDVIKIASMIHQLKRIQSNEIGLTDTYYALKETILELGYLKYAIMAERYPNMSDDELVAIEIPDTELIDYGSKSTKNHPILAKILRDIRTMKEEGFSVTFDNISGVFTRMEAALEMATNLVFEHETELMDDDEESDTERRLDRRQDSQAPTPYDSSAEEEEG